ncbi:hypothetical protein [Micromonospora chersina]
MTPNAAQIADRPDVFAVVDEVAGSRVFRYVGDPLMRPPRPRPAD